MPKYAFIERGPIALPDSTFAESFSFDELNLRNVQTGHILLVTGEKKEGETGISTFTIDALMEDGSVISGIPFLKKRNDTFRFDEITSDTINMQDCPQWREYMFYAETLAKYGAARIRVKLTAVENSTVNRCVLIEGERQRYSGEVHYDD